MWAMARRAPMPSVTFRKLRKRSDSNCSQAKLLTVRTALSTSSATSLALAMEA